MAESIFAVRKPCPRGLSFTLAAFFEETGADHLEKAHNAEFDRCWASESLSS
jgi:hypothetical protein